MAKIWGLIGNCCQRRGEGHFRTVTEERREGEESAIAQEPQMAQHSGMTHPEARFIVEVTADDEIVCRSPKKAEQRIRMADLAAVYVETNESGPWGADVWWLLKDCSGQTRVMFPQLATGEEAALERLQQLPGFQVRGMNSIGIGRHMCWPRPTP